MKTATVITTPEVSVDRILAITAEKQQLQVEIDSLNREMGAKDALVEKLDSTIKELKDSLPEVRFVTMVRERDSWGCTTQEAKIEFRNLGAAQDEIRKELEKKYSNDIKELDSLKSELDNLKKSYENERKTNALDSKIYKDTVRRDYLEKEKELTIRIEELEEELDKTLNDKTDAQEQERRSKEINSLKERIIVLENELKKTKGFGLFKRIWENLCNGIARVKAQKELLQIQTELNRIKCWW
jgi:chromosome segregation ATPase